MELMVEKLQDTVEVVKNGARSLEVLQEADMSRSIHREDAAAFLESTNKKMGSIFNSAASATGLDEVVVRDAISGKYFRAVWMIALAEVPQDAAQDILDGNSMANATRQR